MLGLSHRGNLFVCYYLTELFNAVPPILFPSLRYDHPICIIADLQGPKLRVGTFQNGNVHLREGQNFRYTIWTKVDCSE